MKCSTFRNRLLAWDHPDRPPADARAHLDACAACRDWQRRLVRLERQLPRLPVPPSAAKGRVIRQILTAPLAPQRSPSAPSARDRGLQKLSLAFALAAALALFTVGWWAWQFEGQGPAPARRPAGDPLLASLLQRDLRLAVAGSARQRVETLADLADDLHGEALPLAHAAAFEELAGLAQLYAQVVRGGILAQARRLAPDEWQPVLGPIVGRLARAGGDAEGLARDLPAESAAPLRAMAAAAREGDALAVAAVSAEPPAPLPPSPERARRYRQNHGLVVLLVQGGLRLAGEDDPLRRADFCNDLAEGLAAEIQRAADNHEGGRAAELGHLLHALLKDGVAANLLTVHVALEGEGRDSSLEKKLQDVQRRTAGVVQPLEKQLQRAVKPPAAAKDEPVPDVPDRENRHEMQRALRAVNDGRSEVLNAVKGPRKADGP
jgi:hypothetical protein